VSGSKDPVKVQILIGFHKCPNSTTTTAVHRSVTDKHILPWQAQEVLQTIPSEKHIQFRF
jgi:hypothetical protein